MDHKHQHIRKHFQIKDPIIYKAMKNLKIEQWITPHSPKSGKHYFEHLTGDIIGQQLSGKAANTIYSRFKALFPGNKIEPQKLLKIPDQTLRNAGLSWAKASYVKNIARAYLDQTVKFDKFSDLPDQEIIEELTTIKGVGPWTAEMFLMFTLGRENVFSHGDLGLKKGFCLLYKIETPSRDQIEKVITKWSPYKSYASITLWHSLENT